MMSVARDKTMVVEAKQKTAVKSGASSPRMCRNMQDTLSHTTSFVISVSIWISFAD